MTAVTDLHPCGGLRVLDGMALSWGDLRNSFSLFLDGDVNRLPTLTSPKSKSSTAVLNGGLDYFKFALTVNLVAVGHGLGGCHVAEV